MKVVVTRRIPEVGIEMLREKYQIITNFDDHQMTKAEIIEAIQDADAVITSLTDPIDREVIESAEKVRIFANYAVGFNNIDTEAAQDHRKIVTNTPDVLSDTTAEVAWALLFSSARRIAEADRFVRAGKWSSFSADLMLGQDIHDKTIGIIGAGRIGRRFAEKARGYNNKILYHNRKRALDFEKSHNARYASMDELLEEADFVSVHVPFAPDTRHLIGEAQLRRMKKNAILINTSRGPVVDEAALARALKEGWIWGAGLDVYENEPQIHPELLKLENVVLLPHIGSATTETRDSMSELCARNIISVLEGRKPLTPVF